MLRMFAIVFGIVFVFIGVAGLFPSFSSNGLLFGWFEVDFMHNIAHIATGVIAIMAATRYKLARLFFIIFGFIYAILGIVGFARGGDLSFMGMHVNMADNFLHIIVGAIALFVGFKSNKTQP